MSLRPALLMALASLACPAAAPAAGSVDYIRDVRPILAKNCYQCHGLKAQKAGLRVDTVAALKEGGDSGPAVVPGKSADSLLIRAVTGADGVTPMPLKRPALSAAQVATLKAWIDAGAPAPKTDTADDGKQGQTHWAFIPPTRPAPPEIPNPKSQIRNPIDAFVLARLVKEGIAPAPEADRATLIRRVSLDLTGLPPTPAEVEAFLTDRSPDAYGRLVDRLLASPAYGERWGRHWLDLARYADSNGYSIDAPREIWKYRDYVLDALNRDLPFSQFVVEQVAGDLLPNATLEQRVATGFHRNTQINQEGGIDPEQFRVEAVADRVATTGQVFLGLTLGCCRCHDHKYDPLTQREFYQLFAFFNNQDEPALEFATPEQSAKRKAVRERLEAIETELKPEEARIFAALTDAEKEKQHDLVAAHVLGLPQRSDRQKQAVLKFLAARDPKLKPKVAEYNRMKASEPKTVTTMVLAERKEPRATYVHLGGDFTRHGPAVTPGVPAVLHPLAAKAQAAPNRLDLARWLASRDNPLTARVTVNRVWQHYFGKGLVETENDFGTQGSPPSHPELLDWLAVEFMDSGWSLKHLHRLVVTSATYRQSSAARPELRTVDPANRLLARQTRLRLEAEVIRDCALTASGLLTVKLGGPGVRPPQPDGVFKFTQVKRDWQADAGPDRFRRGLYTYFWRAAPHPALLVFDAPDAASSCTRRLRSNTPLQALTLLNDQAYVELAAGLAGRLLREPAADDDARLRSAVRLCLGRDPAPAELARLRQFLDLQTAEYESDSEAAKKLAAGVGVDVEPTRAAAWAAVARVLINLDEFITRE
ncbi:MAG TPA: PSD1 and planctomycete cytochrome C domain-containing protein [Gemmataceae bacterium]|jgi:mono/diheme cytochrome c family protein